MSKPRVIFAYRYGVLGGVSAQLLNRYESFVSRFDIRILYAEDYGMAARFPDGVVQVAPSVADQAAAIETYAPHLLVVIDSPTFIDAWKRARRPGRLVLEVHTTTKNLEYLSLLSQDSGIDAILTVGSYMQRQLEAAGLAQLAPLHVVPNCLDARWFEPVAPQPLTERPLLWIGKMDDHKRWRSAVDLFDEALVDLSDVRPLFIGGYTGPEAEIDAFLVRLQRSPVLRRSLWWPFVAYERMPILYASAGAANGAMAMTTRNESFGMAVAEALLMGCPVVAPRVGALPDLLPDDAMYDDGDWAAASSLLQRLLSDSGFRRSIVETGSDGLAERVSPQRALEAFAAAVEPLLDKAGANA